MNTPDNPFGGSLSSADAEAKVGDEKVIFEKLGPIEYGKRLYKWRWKGIDTEFSPHTKAAKEVAETAEKHPEELLVSSLTKLRPGAIQGWRRGIAFTEATAAVGVILHGGYNLKHAAFGYTDKTTGDYHEGSMLPLAIGLSEIGTGALLIQHVLTGNLTPWKPVGLSFMLR